MEKLLYVGVGVVLGIGIARLIFPAQPELVADRQMTPAERLLHEHGVPPRTVTDTNVLRAAIDQRAAPQWPQQAGSGAATRAQWLARLRSLLHEQRWDEALALYEEFLRNDEDADQSIKQLFVTTAQGLRGNNELDAAMQLSQSFLTHDYRDVDFLIEAALIYEQLNLWQKSLESFQLGLTYVDETSGREQLQQSLLQFVARQDRRLYAEDELSMLVDLYELLLELNLDDAYLNGIYYRLARLYFQQGEQSRAIESLSMLDSAAEWRHKSQQLLDEYFPPEAAPPASEGEVVGLLKLGEHYVVEVVLAGRQRARLLVDTGASMSVLGKQFYQGARSQVDFMPLGNRRFSTAGGRVRAPYYLLPSVDINTQSVKDVGVAVMEMELPANVDGLLGMNVLKHFRFQIDQDRRELRLQPR